MKGKKELFFLTVSLVFFMIDLGTDIFLAVEYNRKGEDLWFKLTLLFVVGPHVAISVMAAYFAKGNVHRKTLVFVETLFSSLLMHYVKQFRHWKRKYWNDAPCEGCQGNYKECSCTDCKKYREVVKEYNESEYDMAWYRYVETIAESAPQWILQVSIMLDQWNFPGLTVTSAVFSFLALALSITGLEKARVTKEGRDFNLFYTAVFFLFNMFILLSRLSAIVFLIFAYPYLACIVLFYFHWMGMNLIHMKSDDCDCDSCCGTLLAGYPFVNIFTFPFFIHPTKAYYLWLGMEQGISYCYFYIIISVENLIILIPLAPQPATAHLSALKPIVLSFVIIGLVLSCFFAGIYYGNCSCQQDDAEDVEAQNA